MSMRRRLALVAMVTVFVFCFFASGCCLTNRMWQSVSDEPEEFVGASLTADHVLHLAVRYEDGRIWHLEAPLRPGPEWLRTTARRVGPLDGDLPPTAFEMGHREGQVDLSYLHGSDKRGGRDHDVWVDGAGCLAVVTLPEPVHWNAAAPWFASLATPLAFVVDVLTAPVWVLWVFWTAGGHGDCWLPWCN